MLWLVVKVRESALSDEVAPSLTSEAVIAMVGAVLYVQLNCVAAVLSVLVEAFVKVLLATSIVVAPCAVGVNVAVYVVPDPEKLLSVPPLTEMSPTAKSVVLALAVKVRESALSDEVSPSLTSEAVIVMDGVPGKVVVVVVVVLAATAVPHSFLVNVVVGLFED